MSTPSKTRSSGLLLLLTWLAATPCLLPLSAPATAIGMLALVLVPMVGYQFARPNQSALAEPVFLLGGVWVFAVVPPIFFPRAYDTDPVWLSVPGWAVEQAALWIYRGWAAFCLGYWAVRLLKRRERRPNLPLGDRETDLLFQRLVGLTGLIGGLLILIAVHGQTFVFVATAESTDTSTTREIIGLLQSFIYAYVFLNALKPSLKREPLLDRSLFWAVLAVHAAYIMGAGTKTAILAPAVAWVCGRMSRPQKGDVRMREFGLIVFGGAFVWLVASLIQAYRQEVVSLGVRPGLGLIGTLSFQMNTFASAAVDLFTGKLTHVTGATYREGDLLNRFAHLGPFARVISYTGGKPPYENVIQSFFAPIYSFIPRNLFPDKPVFMNSGEFAKLLGWQFGGYSITLPGSIYWCWGYWGIPPAMASLGALIGWCTMRARGLGSRATMFKVVLILAVVELLYADLEFQPAVTDFVRQFGLAWALHALATVFRKVPVRSEYAQYR